MNPRPSCIPTVVPRTRASSCASSPSAFGGAAPRDRAFVPVDDDDEREYAARPLLPSEEVTMV